MRAVFCAFWDMAAQAARAMCSEAAGLSDGAIAALMLQSARAFVASLAEGVSGLPVAEAAALGVPVIWR